MAIDSLRFRDKYNNRLDETRQGFFAYAGEPHLFHEWVFRTEMRMAASKDEDVAQTVARIVDALKGDALTVAMSIGRAELLTKGGHAKLIEAMRHRVFPLAGTEARDLLQQGLTKSGPMSRATGESMVSYTTRRRRWWELLKSMDPSIEMSDTMLGHLMIESASISQFRSNSSLVSASPTCLSTR